MVYARCQGGIVIFSHPSPFITQFVNSLDGSLRQITGRGLSTSQRCCLAFCVMGTIVTNSICWARFARACLGRYSPAALCWFVVNAAIAWEHLLQASVAVVLSAHGINKGTLVIDDTEKKRSKTTTRIWGVSKMRDKGTGGYVQGQGIVVLLLVTPTITLPVGFAFHRPDPNIRVWRKRVQELKKQGVTRKDLPRRPKRDVAYPTRIALALQLLQQFKLAHPRISVTGVLADAAYGCTQFMDGASTLFRGVQVVSELRCNQRIVFQNRAISLEKYFRRTGVSRTLVVRGQKEEHVIMDSARLRVDCHGKKRFIIALKYEGESDYRFLAATDLTWQTNDIVRIWTLRWLIEVFFADWKGHEGWDALTKQQGEDGSRRGLTLSLLVDHCLLLHPCQIAQMKHKLPAFTVGSLMSHIKADALLTMIEELMTSDDPKKTMEEFAKVLREQFTPRTSGKHMVGRELGCQEPTPSLRYHAERLPVTLPRVRSKRLPTKTQRPRAIA
jgi:hypothetical protein